LPFRVSTLQAFTAEITQHIQLPARTILRQTLARRAPALHRFSFHIVKLEIAAACAPTFLAARVSAAKAFAVLFLAATLPTEALRALRYYPRVLGVGRVHEISYVPV